MKLFCSQFVFYSKSFIKPLKYLVFLYLLFFCKNVFSLEIFDTERGVTVVGKISTIIIRENENVADIANRYKTGFQDLLIANPNAHHWSPQKDSKYIIPSMYILPQEDYNGIIINLAELRLYYYMPNSDLYENRKVLTYPVGIGRLDWKTPWGKHT